MVHYLRNLIDHDHNQNVNYLEHHVMNLIEHEHNYLEHHLMNLLDNHHDHNQNYVKYQLLNFVDDNLLNFQIDYVCFIHLYIYFFLYTEKNNMIDRIYISDICFGCCEFKYIPSWWCWCLTSWWCWTLIPIIVGHFDVIKFII